MKIFFNVLGAGIGNNGGSRTVLKSAEVLRSLGHEVEVVASGNNFTWFDHKPTINYIPTDFDVVINATAVDYRSTKNSNTPIKVSWWRAHENWSNSEEYLRSCYLDDTVKNLVNSNGLKELLSSSGADSEVIYQGIDFDWWEDRDLRPINKIRIGALYTKQPRKRWRDFVKLASILGTDEYEYVSIGNATPKDKFLTHSVVNAGHEELCDLYSSCNIWFAPTESEGLHNVPMEAALCGCLIVCSDHKLNGMVLDYAFEDTAMIYEFGNLEMAIDHIENPNWDLVKNMQDYLKEGIGNREDNMRKLVEYLGDINV